MARLTALRFDEMKWRITAIFNLALPAAILACANTSLAQTAPHALPYSAGNWIGAGWYIYSPDVGNEQLEYGVYHSKDQCQSDQKRMHDDANAGLQAAGLSPIPDPHRCAYFGAQPIFDRG
jgi:hypothetical protein